MTIGAIMMIDGVEIIRVGYVTTSLGNFIGILMVCGILVLALAVVVYIGERRSDIVLALTICIAVLIVTLNPIVDLFTYKSYEVKVSDSVTVSELTKDYEILEQNKDGTLVLKEKRSNGKS